MLKKSEILDRCINFGKTSDSSLLEMAELKFIPKFNSYQYGKPRSEIKIDAVYDKGPYVQALGLNEDSAAALLEYSRMLDDDIKGYVKIDGISREVIWIAPFSALQKNHLKLGFDTYLVLKPFEVSK